MTSRVLMVDARCLTGRRTGIATWLAGALSQASPADIVLCIREGQIEDRPGARILRYSRAFHARVAWRVLRSKDRYLSADSLIVAAVVGRRATVVIHDLAPLSRPETQTLRTRLAFRLLLKLAARRAGQIIVPSEATRDELRRFAPKVTTVHVIAEAGRERPDPGPAPANRPAGVVPPFVLFTGTIEPRKNVPDLVDAFRRAGMPGWQLVIAGGWGWVNQQTRTELEAAAHDPAIRLLGFVDDTTLAALYRDAGLFVYPSSYEGFGLPVLEAMSAGAAVITTDAAALSELAAGSAHIVHLAGLREELAHALNVLGNDETARAELRRRGRARAAAFSWGRSSARILAIAYGERP